jgi:hypothetical protein
MSMLSKLISCRPAPEAKHPNKAKMEPLSGRIHVKSEKPHAKYEVEVFNFLFDNREALGIKSVVKFKALLLDGAVELSDGKRLAIEIKFRMNWLKACQAGWQFRNFLRRHKAIAGPVDGGLVFFEEFSGDWKRPAPSRLLQNGWNNWYRTHCEVDAIHVDLLRLCNGKLETFHIAVAANIRPRKEIPGL